MQLYQQVDDLSRKGEGSGVLQERASFTVFDQNKASFKGRGGPRARRRVKLKLIETGDWRRRGVSRKWQEVSEQVDEERE